MAGSKGDGEVYQRGIEALKRRNFDEAAELLSDHLDSNPDDSAAELALAKARSCQGKNAAALIILDRLKERKPNSATVCLERAAVLDRLGRNDEAQAEHQRARRVDPANERGSDQQATFADAEPAQASKSKFVRSAHDEDRATKTVTRTRGGQSIANASRRAVHLVVLVGLGSVIVIAAAIMWARYGAYAGGFVSGRLFGCSLILLLGLRLTQSQKVSEVIGYIIAGLGGLAFVTVLILNVLMPLIPSLEPDWMRTVRSKSAAPSSAPPQQQRPNFMDTRLDSAIAGLRSTDPFQISRAALLVRALSPDAERKSIIVGLLEGHLNHSNQSVKEAAAQSLGTLGTIETVVKLEPLLQNPDKLVRDAAKSAIDQIRKREDPASFEKSEFDQILADLRSNNTDRVRSAAAMVLTARFRADKQTEVVRLLEGHLSHPNQMVRSFMIKALGQWGTSASIAKLEPFLTDKDADIKLSAKLAIDNIRRREKQGK